MTENKDDNPRLNRREFLKVTSLLALGLVYQKPSIETLKPKAVLGQYGQAGGGGNPPPPPPPGSGTQTYRISTGLFTFVITVTATPAGCLSVNPSNQWLNGGWQYSCAPGCSASVTVAFRDAFGRSYTNTHNISC